MLADDSHKIWKCNILFNVLLPGYWARGWGSFAGSVSFKGLSVPST